MTPAALDLTQSGKEDGDDDNNDDDNDDDDFQSEPPRASKSSSKAVPVWEYVDELVHYQTKTVFSPSMGFTLASGTNSRPVVKRYRVLACLIATQGAKKKIKLLLCSSQTDYTGDWELELLVLPSLALPDSCVVHNLDNVLGSLGSFPGILLSLVIVIVIF